MNTNTDYDIGDIIALFHSKNPISYELKEIRMQENDSRWIIYVDFADEKYGKMGYYSPAMMLSRN